MVSHGDGKIGAAKLAGEVIEIMNKINESAQGLTGRSAALVSIHYFMIHSLLQSDCLMLVCVLKSDDYSLQYTLVCSLHPHPFGRASESLQNTLDLQYFRQFVQLPFSNL